MLSIYMLSTIESIIAGWMFVGAFAARSSISSVFDTGSKFSLL